jgi:hypothetical protein
MKKYVAVILALIVPMSIAPAMTAQTATATTKPLTDPPSKKLETLFTDAEIPVTKTKSGLYIGVVTVGDDSDRFSAQADTMGSDPNNTAQFMFPSAISPRGFNFQPPSQNRLFNGIQT